jgi:hypothetical protein
VQEGFKSRRKISLIIYESSTLNKNYYIDLLCTRRRWEDGIRRDLREIGLGGGWIGFDWLRTGTGGELL